MAGYTVSSQMVETYYGSELRVVIRDLEGNILWESQEAMAEKGQIQMFRVAV